MPRRWQVIAYGLPKLRLQLNRLRKAMTPFQSDFAILAQAGDFPAVPVVEERMSFRPGTSLPHFDAFRRGGRGVPGATGTAGRLCGSIQGTGLTGYDRERSGIFLTR